MTGKENIFLNGSILGMKRGEIISKFDEIVEFSGIQRYIDTPVKRYSSGMYIRLAFAIAAHLEPDILIIDEVLAVGDIEFQKKCLSKMESVSKEYGRTVLFVSHNMAAVQSLCTRAILLRAGSIAAQGQVSEVINEYYKSVLSPLQEGKQLSKVVVRVVLEGKSWGIGKKLKIHVDFPEKFTDMYVDLSFYNSLGERVFSIEGTKNHNGRSLQLGRFDSISLLNPGLVNTMLSVDIGIKEHQLSPYVYLDTGVSLIQTEETNSFHPINGFILPAFEIT